MLGDAFYVNNEGVELRWQAHDDPSFWDVARAGGKTVPKDAYVALNVAISKALLPRWTLKAATRTAKAPRLARTSNAFLTVLARRLRGGPQVEWKRDAEGATEMNYRLFFEFVFGVADRWVASCTIPDYTKFLDELFRSVTAHIENSKRTGPKKPKDPETESETESGNDGEQEHNTEGEEGTGTEDSGGDTAAEGTESEEVEAKVRPTASQLQLAEDRRRLEAMNAEPTPDVHMSLVGGTLVVANLDEVSCSMNEWLHSTEDSEKELISQVPPPAPLPAPGGAAHPSGPLRGAVAAPR
eukprot:m51a1_g12659 hypothetical protein (298) ;mRNA; r:31-1164